MEFNVVIPDGVEEIEDRAFSDFAIQLGVKIMSVSIPDSVTKIGAEAFRSSWLSEVTIPDSVVSIGDSAFQGCFILTTVTIGSGIEKIGQLAFADCDRLKEIVFRGKTEDEVKHLPMVHHEDAMYPWGIQHPKSVIKCEP